MINSDQCLNFGSFCPDVLRTREMLALTSNHEQAQTASTAVFRKYAPVLILVETCGEGYDKALDRNRNTE